MSTVTVDYYGIEGRGRNVTEAKRAAGDQIRRAMHGDYSPVVIGYRGHAMLIYRDPLYGWHSATLHDETGQRTGTLHGCTSNDSREECITRARLHVAQMAWKPEDGDTPTAELGLAAHEASDFRSWVRFQLRYREGKAAGLNDNQAHQFAGGWFSSIDQAREGRLPGAYPSDCAEGAAA